MTIYLKFPDQETAVAALLAESYTISDYCDMATGNGWGWMGVIPDVDGFHANLNDCTELAESLVQYQVPAPLTPFNVVAGREVPTVYRCVVVTAAIRDVCRAMVVQLAGPTHAGMWSTELVRQSDGAVFWINSGHVRVELAAMLDDPAALSAGAGITVEQATVLLSLCDVSEEDPFAAMDRLGLKMIQPVMA